MIVDLVASMLLGTGLMPYQFIPSSGILLMYNFPLCFISEADDQFCPPCGSCRQVIAEFGYSSNCLILLVKPSGEYKETTITELLPEPFTRHVLSGKA